MKIIKKFLPDRPPAAAVGGVPWGPLLYPEGAHGAPYFTQPGTQGPLLYPGGAHGAPPWGPHIFSYNISCLAATFYFFAKKIYFYISKNNMFLFLLEL